MWKQEQTLFEETLPHVQIRISSISLKRCGIETSPGKWGYSCVMSHQGKSSARGHCLSLFYSFQSRCNFNDRCLRLHLNLKVLWMCLINPVPSGHQLLLIHIFLAPFYLNDVGLESWEQAPGSLKWTNDQLLTLFTLSLRDHTVVFEDTQIFEVSSEYTVIQSWKQNV